MPLLVAAVAGSAAYSQVKTTSSAVSGLPSCQETFFFSFHVTERPSFATPPFLRLGISAASRATGVPSPSQPARRSLKTARTRLSLGPQCAVGGQRVGARH